jgi:hypothetical protein
MDAHFFVDVNRAGDRRVGRARDKNFDRTSAPVCTVLGNVEWARIEFQIPFVPVGARRRLHRIFRGLISGEFTNRAGLFADPDRNRLFANLCRRALSFRCHLRRAHRDSVGYCRYAIYARR